MGFMGLIVVFSLFAFSLLVMNTSVLPYWLTSNEDLYILAIVLWLVGIGLAFVKFGLGI